MDSAQITEMLQNQIVAGRVIEDAHQRYRTVNNLNRLTSSLHRIGRFGRIKNRYECVQRRKGSQRVRARRDDLKVYRGGRWQFGRTKPCREKQEISGEMAIRLVWTHFGRTSQLG